MATTTRAQNKKSSVDSHWGTTKRTYFLWCSLVKTLKVFQGHQNWYDGRTGKAQWSLSGNFERSILTVLEKKPPWKVSAVSKCANYLKQNQTLCMDAIHFHPTIIKSTGIIVTRVKQQYVDLYTELNMTQNKTLRPQNIHAIIIIHIWTTSSKLDVIKNIFILLWALLSESAIANCFLAPELQTYYHFFKFIMTPFFSWTLPRVDGSNF